MQVVCGVTVALDNLGNVVWVCPVLPGTIANVKIWDKYGPQRTKSCFLEFEVGIHDGANKGRLHCHIPFIGRKILTVRLKTYNDTHGFYRALVEHFSARLRAWRVVRNIWLGSHEDLGGIFGLRAHCALLLDYVPPEEPPSTPLGNTLRIR